MNYGKVKSLCKVLAEVDDPRNAQGQRHEFTAILMLICAAMLCGYDNPNQIATWGQALEADFLRELGFKCGVAIAKSQLCEILSQIDGQQLERLLEAWVESVLQELGMATPLPAIAFDGKTLCGSKKLGAVIAHPLSAVSHGLGLTLYQVGVDSKTNEISVAHELLKGLLIVSRVFTMDVLLTQRQISQTIVDNKGDYFMIAKGNQAHLHRDIEVYFDDMSSQIVPQATTVELGHSRIERRTLYATVELNDYLNLSDPRANFSLTTVAD